MLCVHACCYVSLQATPTAFEVKAANSEGEVPVGKPQSLMEKHKQKLISSKSHRTTSEGGPSGEGLSGEGVDKLRKVRRVCVCSDGELLSW